MCVCFKRITTDLIRQVCHKCKNEKHFISQPWLTISWLADKVTHPVWLPKTFPNWCQQQGDKHTSGILFKPRGLTFHPSSWQTPMQRSSPTLQQWSPTFFGQRSQPLPWWQARSTYWGIERKRLSRLHCNWMKLNTLVQLSNWCGQEHTKSFNFSAT